MTAVSNVELQTVIEQEGPTETEETANNVSPQSQVNENSSDTEVDSKSVVIILAKNRPTLASIGEPSHNIPKKITISVSFVFVIIVCVCIVIGFLSSLMFADVLFQHGIQNMFHWIEDRSNSPLLNFIAVCFTIFDVTIFCISANAGVLLATICGYLYSWPVGSFLYILIFALSNMAVFIIGQTLLRDRMYSKIIASSERYRYAYRVLSDQSMALGIALFVCPFIPAGVVSYVLSLSRISLTHFMIAVSAVVPSTVLLAYSSTLIADADGIGDAYLTNDVIYGCLLFLSFGGVLLFIGIFVRLYLRYSRYYTLAAENEEDEEDGETDGRGADADSDEEEKELVAEKVSQDSRTKTTEGEVETRSEVQTTGESLEIVASVEISESHSSSWEFFNKEEVSESWLAGPRSKHADLAWLKFENQNTNGNNDDMLFAEDFKKKLKSHKDRVEVMP